MGDFKKLEILKVGVSVVMYSDRYCDKCDNYEKRHKIC